MPISQLRRILTTDGNPSRHILVRTVRLTVETNLVTSKRPRAFDVIMWPLSHTRLATVSITALVIVAVFPVSGSARRASFNQD